jgi:WD40 repeat protein
MPRRSELFLRHDVRPVLDLVAVFHALICIANGILNHVATADSISPDGKWFATGIGIAFSSSGSLMIPISLWDTASGRKLSTLSGAFDPFAFRPDGKALLAYADQSRMVAIELGTMRLLWSTPPLSGQWVGEMDFSADASIVSAKRYGDARIVWLRRLNVGTGKDCAEPLRGWGDIAVAPGGKLAATGRTEKGETYIDLVELPSGRRTTSLRSGAPTLNQLVFSPDGKSLYVSAREGDPGKGSSYFARIWAADTQRAASPLMAHTGSGFCTPSGDRPDGRYFATGSNPGPLATGELRLWDTSTGRLLFPPTSRSPRRSPSP